MKYLARRLVHATLLLLAVSIFSFAIMQLAPGDYFAPMGLNPQISSRTIAGLRSQYGLDRSLPVRYAHWLHGVLKGDQHTAAMLDQHTAAMLDGSQYAAFGHGTMVMGIIHLVAPTAKLLPLKAFSANGSGSLSNILAAIYYAVQNNANVINMSFDLTTSSTELRTAINYANSHNVICVASSGNDGEQEMVYPAGLQYVIGVASTNNEDQRSSFSNYGNQIVWVAAPGEGVITTYPFATYAAGWGTSFSSPMVAGTASLIVNMQPTFGENQAAWTIAHAKWIGINMGNGRLDVYGALWSLNPIQGLLQ